MIFSTLLAFDIVRNDAYIDFLKENAKDKIIVDCGSGSGIWTWVALYYGAAHVYCVDVHQPTIDHLTTLYKNNSKVSVLKLDLFKDQLPAGDFYIHEIFASDPFSEGLISFLKNCRKQNISSIYPNRLTLYHSTEITVKKKDIEYNLDNLQSCIKDFLKYMTDTYQKDLDYDFYISKLTSQYYNFSNKDKIWEGDLLDLLDAPNLNIKKEGYISWDANLDNFSYSSTNENFNNWNIGFSTSTKLKKTYIKFLRMHNDDALRFNCTYYIT